MKRVTTYYCDYCGYHNQNKLKLLKHEEVCNNKKNIALRVKHHLETLIKAYRELGYVVDFRTLDKEVEVYVVPINKK